MATDKKSPQPPSDLRIKATPEELAKAMFQPTPKKS